MSNEIKKLYDERRAIIKEQLRKFMNEITEMIERKKEEIYKEVL
ncbi:MAG: hypothetical protein QXI49_06920 [Candidatus Methanomethylicaceae archaeon]